MTVPTASERNVAELLDRADINRNRSRNKKQPDRLRLDYLSMFIQDTTTALLLEHLRRADPGAADRVSDWVLEAHGIFSDGRAGDLLDVWRGQLAAGEPMHPIGPEDTTSTTRPFKDLALRLVDAASDAFDVGTLNFDAVVANVLRELATDALGFLPYRLREVADQVERVSR